jgi:hypothetical protein
MVDMKTSLELKNRPQDDRGDPTPLTGPAARQTTTLCMPSLLRVTMPTLCRIGDKGKQALFQLGVCFRFNGLYPANSGGSSCIGDSVAYRVAFWLDLKG